MVEVKIFGVDVVEEYSHSLIGGSLGPLKPSHFLVPEVYRKQWCLSLS